MGVLVVRTEVVTPLQLLEALVAAVAAGVPAAVAAAVTPVVTAVGLPVVVALGIQEHHKLTLPEFNLGMG
jgi:hypothetical protein